MLTFNNSVNPLKELEEAIKKETPSLTIEDYLVEVREIRFIVEKDGEAILNSTNPARIEEVLSNRTLMCNDKVTVRQSISFIARMMNEDERALALKLEANHSMTEISVLIPKDVPITSEIRKNFVKIAEGVLTRKMLVYKILIKPLNNMRDKLKKVQNNIPPMSTTIGNTYKFILFKWFEPITADITQVRYDFIDKYEITKTEGMGRIAAVWLDSGDKVVSWPGGKISKYGRDAKGNFMNLDDKEQQIDLEGWKILSGISDREDEDTYSLIAEDNGFLVIDRKSKTFKIQPELSLEDINTVNFGYVVAGRRDKGVIKVRSSSKDTDAVANNITMTAGEIIVTGNIGAESKIYAQTATIDNTHARSQVFADDANIKTHRGLLSCKNANIETLQSGTVHADFASIGTSFSGSISGDNIKVNVLENENKINFRRSLEIAAENGISNTIKLTPFVMSEEGRMAIDMKNRIKTIREKDILAIEYELGKIKDKINDNKKGVDVAKKNFDEMRIKGQAVPDSIIEQLQTYKKMLIEANAFEDKLKEMDKDIAEINKKFMDISLPLNNAVIKSNFGWKENNRIFVPENLNVDNNKELEYIPTEQDKELNMQSVSLMAKK